MRAWHGALGRAVVPAAALALVLVLVLALAVAACGRAGPPVRPKRAPQLAPPTEVAPIASPDPETPAEKAPSEIEPEEEPEP